VVWLRVVSQPAVIESLLTDINTKLEKELTATKAGIQALTATANLPLRDLDTALAEAATKLNFGTVIERWREAQGALGIDPPDATTRASSLIETLCRHILHARGAPLPNNQDIQHVYGAAVRTLSLSPEQQRTNDLRALAGGMNTIVTAVGTLRTHAGTAHGRGPENQPITFAQARLAVNAAGILATYLMEALNENVTAATA
jgi:hypothetical protein